MVMLVLVNFIERLDHPKDAFALIDDGSYTWHDVSKPGSHFLVRTLHSYWADSDEDVRSGTITGQRLTRHGDTCNMTFLHADYSV